MKINIDNLISKENFSILYVEDEDNIRIQLADILKEEFKNVFVAKDGKEGLEIFKKELPDMVITDIKMPRLDGVKMSKSIKEISPSTPIIITTAFSDSDYLIEAIEINIDKYMIKPIDIEVLVDVIEEIKNTLFMKKELKMQYKLIEFMLDSNPNFIFIIQNRKIIYINKSFLNYLNFDSFDEFEKKECSICDFISKNGLTKENEFVNYIFENRDENITLELKNSNLEYKTFALFYNYFSDIDIYLFTLNDITKLQKEKNRLERKSLMQEKMLEIQSRQAEMGEMISAITHQWRQPLSVLAMSTTNLEVDVELNEIMNKQEIKEYIKNITEQVNFMSQTIDDFRNFFKPTKENQIFDIKEAIENAKKLISSQLKKSNLNVEIKGEGFSIKKVKNEFQQVILNLLSNAKDALVLKQKENKAFTPKIEVIIDNEQKSIEIIDNAGGIPEDIIDKIFEPYFSTKGNKGSGIGLYISKNIIKKMGYELKVENSNDGAVFTILCS